MWPPLSSADANEVACRLGGKENSNGGASGSGPLAPGYACGRGGAVGAGGGGGKYGGETVVILCPLFSHWRTETPDLRTEQDSSKECYFRPIAG